MAEGDNGDPKVSFTVKELVLRVEGKLDAYALQQGELANIVHRLEPTVKAQGDKIEKLELIQLGKEAVKTWHNNMWRAVFAVVGAGSGALLAFAAIHVH